MEKEEKKEKEEPVLPRTFELKYPIELAKDNIVREITVKSPPRAMTHLPIDPDKLTWGHYIPALAGMTDMPEIVFRKMYHADYAQIMGFAIDFFM